MVPDRLRVVSPAKLNLGLRVVAKRADGYHDLSTIFQAIDLADTLLLERLPQNTVTLSCTDSALPTDEGNLVVRAANALRAKTGVALGAAIHLEKRIPAGAGLGGGSSNAAAALVALNTLWELGMAPRELASVALELGSDVPFFLFGGAALGAGRGELLTPLDSLPWKGGWVLTLPDLHASTGEVFARLRAVTGESARPQALARAMKEVDSDSLKEALHNDLEAPAQALHPILGRLRRDLERTLPSGSVVAMTGSGSGYYCMTPDRGEAQAWIDEGALWRAGPWVRDSGLDDRDEPADTEKVRVRAMLCAPVAHGVHMIQENTHA